MDIIVTRHAIEQYRRRMFDEQATDAEITKLLTKIARKGRKECRRPPFAGNVFKITYKEYSIIVDYREKPIVLTFLGNKRYQKWFYRTEIKPRALCG